MSASEIVSAYEDHLITAAEAVEQGMTASLDELYHRASRERRRPGAKQIRAA